jgi:hypothetical protein
MNRALRKSNAALRLCAARAADACCRAASGRASEALNGASAVHVPPVSPARHEVSS